CLQGYIFPFTF
nr:immunoglobulin light chain junction region [Macaca mulatta]